MLGEELKEIRVALGWDQQKMGDYLACGKSYICRMERGSSTIRGARLQLLEILKVSAFMMKVTEQGRFHE